MTCRAESALLINSAYVREGSITLRPVESVADDPHIRNVETEIGHGNINLEPVRLAQQRACGKRPRAASVEHPHEVLDRVARIYDVLDDKNIAIPDVEAHVHQQAHCAGVHRVFRFAVARNRDEFDPMFDLHAARQVGKEDERALEDTNHDQLFGGLIVAIDFFGQLGDTSCNGFFCDQHFGHDVSVASGRGERLLGIVLL